VEAVMGRMRDTSSSPEEFRRRMEDALLRMTSGLSRREAKWQIVEDYRAKMEELREHFEKSGLPVPETDQEGLERFAETAIHVSRSAPLTRGKDGVWRPVVEDGSSRLSDDYDFIDPRPWDHDDCAEYCLDAEGSEEYKRLFTRWLAHQWAGKRRPEAREALRKQFQPLVGTLLGQYRRAAGSTLDGESGRKIVQGYLDEALDQFDFFYKNYAQIGNARVSLERDPFRMAGRITSDFELPIALFIEIRLVSRLRTDIEPHRVEGPFTIEPDTEKYLLIEDVCVLLGRSPSTIRRYIRGGLLSAEKPPQLRKRLGIPPSAEFILYNVNGRVRLSHGDYWIFRASDVLGFLQRRADGQLKRRKTGRPRKSPTSESE
jgi:hypothetical protein